ncbi:hypothetical protein H6P81_003648 [Aristolochia fimbriata]|uniref:Uncharacterized protein n=1 Tax=Aristolochia fimbriata TaxID=158543 RepID=A0AAV7FD78_ARIFI|nr:hypothetical protein H6P81_003648 [Aristolochia fimbriata]
MKRNYCPRINGKVLSMLRYMPDDDTRKGYCVTLYDLINRKRSCVNLPESASSSRKYFSWIVWFATREKIITGCEGTSFWLQYDFSSGEWRNCAPMPGPPRVEFVSLTNPLLGIILVAGGYDPVGKKVLNSAMAYEAERDEWIPLPPMPGSPVHPGFGKNDCYKFSAIVGDGHCERFDLTTFSWSLVEIEQVEQEDSDRGGFGAIILDEDSMSAKIHCKSFFTSSKASDSAAAAAQIHQIDGLPCFSAAIYGPRFPQRKKLVAAKSMFVVSTNDEYSREPMTRRTDGEAINQLNLSQISPLQPVWPVFGNFMVLAKVEF